MIVLDTHVLLWMDQDTARLGQRARALISDAWEHGVVAVSAISFWEVAMLAAKGRIKTSLDLLRWRDELMGAGLVELPVDGATGIASTRFESLHSDPADRMIVATAVLNSATLITAEERLLQWRGALERYDARM